MLLSDYIAAVKAGNVSVVEQAHRALASTKKIDADYHYINALAEERMLAEAAVIDRAVKAGTSGRLAGVAVSVKDCLCVKGVESTAGSDVLRGYKPLFDATAVHRAVRAGGMVLGKTAQDEFGFGGFSVNVGKGFCIPRHPL